MCNAVLPVIGASGTTSAKYCRLLLYLVLGMRLVPLTGKIFRSGTTSSCITTYVTNLVFPVSGTNGTTNAKSKIYVFSI